MARSDRNQLSARLSALRKFLAAVPEGDFVSRVSIESNIREVERLLAEAASERKVALARALLTFKGRPVDGTRGIDADFAGRALHGFQKVVSLVAAEQSTRPLKKKGKVPDRSRTSFRVTDVARGSFGFVLEERTEDYGQLVVLDGAESDLTRALRTTTAILDAAGDEQRLLKALSGNDKRVFASTKEFIGHLAASGASLALDAGDRSVRLTRRHLEGAAGTLSRAEHTTDKVQVHGCLVGVLPYDREFEFWRADTETVILGKLGPGVNGLDLTRFAADPRAGTRQTATMLVRRVTRQRESSESHVLIELAPQEPAPTADPLRLTDR